MKYSVGQQVKMIGCYPWDMMFCSDEGFPIGGLYYISRITGGGEGKKEVLLEKYLGAYEKQRYNDVFCVNISHIQPVSEANLEDWL